MEMEYGTLGRTGLEVSVAGLGCGGNSKLGLASGRSEAQAVEIVRRALDLGVNFFDTAAAYGTEAVVGEGLRGVPRDRVVISTKALVERDGANRLRPYGRSAQRDVWVTRLQCPILVRSAAKPPRRGQSADRQVHRRRYAGA